MALGPSSERALHRGPSYQLLLRFICPSLWRAVQEGQPIICLSALFAPLWRAARPRSERSVGGPVETYGEHMGSPCDPHMFPIRSPYVRHMGKISKTTKSYVAHMLSNIWENLWATQQHMGNIWGNVVIFAFKLALLNIWGTYGKHMGNIWETYGEHTQSNTQQNLFLPLLMQHPQGQSGFHKVCFESLFIINKDGRMNSGSTARADEILT